MTVAEYQVRQSQLPGMAEVQKAPPPRDVNAEHERSFSGMERIAIWVTDRVGTMEFFFIIATWTVVWLAWNTVAPTALRFDPAPAFVLWLFISNLIQIHLMPLILVSQNLQERFTQLRADADYEVNQKAEREVRVILQHLAHQNDLMLEILRRIERIETSRTP